MIAVAQTVWICSVLIGTAWLYWLSARAQADRNALEELIDRADQILGTAPTRPMPAVTGPRPQWGEAAMPKPTPGPATVPVGQAIDAWQQGIGKHAAKGTK